MKKKRILRILYEIAALLLTVLILASGLYWLGDRLMPKRETYGAVWSSYLQEEKNTVDVLFLGSSRVYCSVIPAKLWQNTGVRSYVMAGPSQTAPLTYYYLRECLKTQTPQVVFVEASCAYSKLTEDYSMANVCYMPFSENRILAACACEKGILKLALFPLEEFHGRILEVGHAGLLHPGEQASIKTESEAPAENGMLLCGYTPLAEARAQTERTFFETAVQPGDETYEVNLSYLRRIAALCRDRGIRCVFFLAPTMQPLTDDARARLLSDLSALPCEKAEDWEDLIGGIGIDNACDWYDALHFNTNGAFKFTDHLSAYIEGLELEERTGCDSAVWTQRAEYAQKLQLSLQNSGKSLY